MKVEGEIGGVEARRMAEEEGTPLFVYNEEKIRKKYRKLEEEFKSGYDNFRINYAVKANSTPQ